jgi:DHA1 family bicyclomycin/chloramphenicol resistance-like MFS transporter
MISFAWLSYFSFLTSASFIFQDGIGTSALEFGLCFSLVGLGFVSGTFIARKALVKVHYDVLLQYTAYFHLLCAICFFVPAFFGILNVPVVLIPMIFFAVSLGIIFPTTQAALASHFPTIAGVAFGLFFFTEMMFGFVGSLIMSSIHEDNQLPLATLILISAVLMMLSFLKLKRKGVR